MKTKTHNITFILLLIFYSLFSFDSSREYLRKSTLGIFDLHFYSELLVLETIAAFCALLITVIGLSLNYSANSPNKKYTLHRSMIFIGGFLLIYSSTNSSIHYFSMGLLDEMPYRISTELEEKMKDAALKDNKCTDCVESNGKTIARLYFIETGKITKYSDINGDIREFIPQVEDTTKRNKSISTKPKYTNFKKYISSAFYTKLFFVFSCIFLWLYFITKKITET